MLDYNQEAKKLFDSLDGSTRSRFNNLDPIYRSEAGGFIYVGGDLVRILLPINQLSAVCLQAARDLTGLQRRGVTAVVNCTTNIQCFHKGSLDYFIFDVAFWRREVLGRLNGELSAFLKPVLEFINDVINRGESVLVHCLAGAHRAGTTGQLGRNYPEELSDWPIFVSGIICLMHFQGIDSNTAISMAKNRRPIIEPIGDFRELLSRCDHLQRNLNNKFVLWKSCEQKVQFSTLKILMWTWP